MVSKIRLCLRIGCLISLALLLAPLSLARAQAVFHLDIDQVDFSRFPQVDVVVSVRDSFGIPVQDLFDEHFSLTEAGQAVADFEVSPLFEHPLDLVLVMDTSATTGYGLEPTPLQSAARAAKSLVNSLGEQDRAAVVAFGDTATIVQPPTDNKHPVNASLALLEPAGNSALNDALLAALGLLKGAARPLIVLFTDGPDSGRSQLNTTQVAQAAYQQGVPIFIIGWRSADTRDLLNLAALTSGSNQFLPGSIPAPEDLQAAINSLQPSLNDLRGQYHLSYTSSLLADNQEHPLEIQVSHQGRRQQAAASLTAISRLVSVTMKDLQDGQAVGGIVTLAPLVTAPAPLASLELLVDGAPLANLDPLAPEATYDTAVLTPGPHRLTALAADTSGNRGQLDLTLDVRPPVTVTLLAPAAGSDLRGETVIAAKVESIPDIARVEFWVDGQLMYVRETAPYEVAWDSAGLDAGQHQLRLVAYDVQGHSAEAAVSVRIPPRSYLLPLLLVLVVLGGVAAAIIVPLHLRQQRDQELSALYTREKACLREQEGLNPGRVWLLDKDEFRLGRKREENDLPLKGLSSSRQQAVIRYQASHYVLFSLNPEKPALVNEIPAHPQAVLKPGDIIRLGETVLHFEMPG